MALRRLSTSSIQTNGKSSKLWDQTTFQSGMFAIATVSLASATSTISFDNIPSNYTHLQVRALCLNTGQDNLSMYFNADTTGANYRDHQFGANGQGSGYAYSNAGVNSYGATIGITSQTTPAGNIIDILDYASATKTKTSRALGGVDRNGAGNIQLYSHLWTTSNAPITKITFTVGTYPFQANTHFALYGIKTV